MMKWIGIVFGGLIGLALLAGMTLYAIGVQKLTRTYPDMAVETVIIPSDPGAVARGGHIAIVWACTKCHGPDLGGMSIRNDPIEGTIPILGTIPASNLTSGKGGIAKTYTDKDWVQSIRHGVKPNNRVEVLMYDYSTLSDQDLGDLIAYLQQIPPVDWERSEMRLGPIIPIAAAAGLFTPAAELIDHGAPRPAEPAPGATKEYGSYLSVLCTWCHGKSVADKLEKWSQEEFVRAIHTGVLPNGQQFGATMSSETFREMNDMELTALWLYLVDAKP
jgi:cytochrome c553